MGLLTKCGYQLLYWLALIVSLFYLVVFVKYLYLHGFASSTQSIKAQFFLKQFKLLNIELEIPDLNLGDFSNLKITQQLAYIKSQINPVEEYTLIGSSLGGLLSLITAEGCHMVKKLILLAPALEIKNLWSRELGDEGIVAWQENRFCNVYHSGYKSQIPLSYGFIEDMQTITDRGFSRILPVLIIHGKNDETIPLAVSYRYKDTNRMAHVVELDSGHGLDDRLEEIWQLSKAYLFE